MIKPAVAILCAASTIVLCACTAVPPSGDMLALTREAMAASAELRQAADQPGSSASQAADAVTRWRGAASGARGSGDGGGPVVEAPTPMGG